VGLLEECQTRLIILRCAVDRYLECGAAKEINVGHQLRESVLEEIRKGAAVSMIGPEARASTVFDQADREIRKLIWDGQYVRTFSLLVAQNIGDAERRRRFWAGVVTGLISLVMFAALLTCLHDDLTSRLARIATLVPNLMCCRLLLSAKLGISSHMISRGESLVRALVWLSVYQFVGGLFGCPMLNAHELYGPHTQELESARMQNARMRRARSLRCSSGCWTRLCAVP